MNENTLIVGANMRRIRLNIKPYPPSQTEIARKAVQILGPEVGKSILESERLLRQRLANMESGRSARLTAQLISALAQALGCTEAELLDSSGVKIEPEPASAKPSVSRYARIVMNIAVVAFPEPLAGNLRSIPHYMANGYALPGSLDPESSYVAVTIKSNTDKIRNGEIWFFRSLGDHELPYLSEVTVLFTDENRALFVFNIGADTSEILPVIREVAVPKNLKPLGVLVHREQTDPAGILVL